MNRTLRGPAVVLIGAALSLGTIGCSTDYSTDASSDQKSEQEYDSKGFPLDESGDVSSDPEDYREAVCDTEIAKEMSDYEEECE